MVSNNPMVMVSNNPRVMVSNNPMVMVSNNPILPSGICVIDVKSGIVKGIVKGMW